MYFLIEEDELLKNIMTFGIKPEIILTKNLMAHPTTSNFYENQNKILQWRGYRFSC